MLQAKTVLDFWFGNPDEEDYGKPRKAWFVKKTEFDQEVRSRFGEYYQQAATGNLNHWRESPDGCLALILLLDQFPRNMFRDRPQAFATDSQALAVAQYAIISEFDQKLLPLQRWFIYIPFEHSENLQDQRYCVELFSSLKDDPYSADAIDYAYRHLKIIERFGRFPHRNKILNRESTPEEVEFLKQPGSSF